MNKNMFLALVLTLGVTGFVTAVGTDKNNQKKDGEQSKALVTTTKLAEGQTSTNQNTQVNNAPVASNGVVATVVSTVIGAPLAFVGLSTLSTWVNAHEYYTILAVAALTAGGVYGVNALLENLDVDADDNN